MSTQVSNPYSFNIVNNATFSTSILNDLTMIGNATFKLYDTKPTYRTIQIVTRAMSFSVAGGSMSLQKCGSFDQSNNTDIGLVMFNINENQSSMFGADCVIMISSSTNRVKYAAYVEIDNMYRIGVYLGYKINNDVYTNANGDRYYQSSVWKKNGSSFSEATPTEIIDYVVSKNCRCNLVSWIKAL